MQAVHVSSDGDANISNTKRNGSNTTRVIIKDNVTAKFIITTVRTAVMTIVVLELSICYMVMQGYGHMLSQNATF